jgi:putative transposase
MRRVINPNGVASGGKAIMPQSLSSVHIHLVFSTKGRQPFLRNEEIRKEMHAYLGGVSKKLDCSPVVVGGTEDHTHLLCRLARTITQADWVKEIKRVSSIWIKQREPTLAAFAWQGGYGAFSVSASAIDKTYEYIANQQEHHKKQTFQDEYRAFLRKHGMEWDERFVWE